MVWRRHVETTRLIWKGSISQRFYHNISKYNWTMFSFNNIPCVRLMTRLGHWTKHSLNHVDYYIFYIIFYIFSLFVYLLFVPNFAMGFFLFVFTQWNETRHLLATLSYCTTRNTKLLTREEFVSTTREYIDSRYRAPPNTAFGYDR